MAERAVVIVVLLSLATIVNCTFNLNNIIFNGEYEFIDLTHPFDNNTQYWPTSEKFKFTSKDALFRSDGTWYAANNFAAGEHGGTHIDAPYHFSSYGKFVGDLPLETLIVPLITIDLRSKVKDDPNYILYNYDLDYQLLNDNTAQPCVIVFNFGWSKYFNDRLKYMGVNQVTGAFNFPGISREVIELLTTSYKNVVGIGVDTASVDYGSNKEADVHKIGTAAGLYFIENVNLYRPVLASGCTALALPMKIAEGSGAPVRFVALCPKPRLTRNLYGEFFLRH